MLRITLATALVAAGLPFVAMQSASAVDYHFVIDSLAFTGGDANTNDGVCATISGTCTLRAALDQSNALNARPGDVLITVAPGLDGTVEVNHSLNTFMRASAVTTLGDNGAYYQIVSPVTVDLDNRLRVRATGSYPLAAAFHLDGPDINLHNFTDILSLGTSFVMGPNAARVVLDGGSTHNTSDARPQRLMVFRPGATDVTVRNYSATGLADAASGLFTFNAPGNDRTPIKNIVIDNVEARYPTNGTCTNGIPIIGSPDGRGCKSSIVTVSPMVDTVNIDGLSFTNSVVQNLSSANYGFKFSDGSQGTASGAVLSNLDISNNQFINNVGRGTGVENAFVKLPHRWMEGTNRIVGNAFVRGATGNNHAIYWDGITGTSTIDSNLEISDNYFDGYTTNSIRLFNTGNVTVARNTFGTRSGSQVRPATGESVGNTNVLVANLTEDSNGRINTWYPSGTGRVLTGAAPDDALAVTNPAADPGIQTCVASVEVTQPTGAPDAPATLSMYWTADRTAELYLGEVTVATGSNATLTFPLPVGAQDLPGTVIGSPNQTQAVDPTTGVVNGYVRLQTLVETDSKMQSSQYSQIVSVRGTCRPSLTINQASGQNDPSMGRDLHFTLTSTMMLDEATVTPDDFDLTASATDATIDPSRINARVVAIDPIEGSNGLHLDVVVRVDDSATVTMAIGADKVAAAFGMTNANAATSHDNTITFVNPLITTPSQFTIVTGDPEGKPYTLGIRPGAPLPTANLDFQSVVDQVGLDRNVTPSTLTPVIVAGGTSTAPITVTAAAGEVEAGTSVTISATVTSDDPNYDNLVVPSLTPILFSTDPTITISKSGYVDVTDTSTPESIELTGTLVPTGSRLADGQAVCFVYTVSNTSAGDWETVLTDAVVTDTDKRLGADGVIDTIPVLGIGESVKRSACTVLIPVDTTVNGAGQSEEAAVQ